MAIDATVSPWGVAADRIGNLFIADYECSRIWKVSINGEISTVVGNGDVYASYESGLPATQTAFYSRSVAVDLLENLYYPMSGEVRKVGDDGISRTIAGGGVVDAPASDGGLALNASLRVVEAVAVDIYGNVFITDRDTKLVSKLAPQYAPGIPILSGITAEAGQLSVSFLPPGSTGSTPISSYAAICSPAAGGPSTRVNGTSSPIVVGSLTDGVAYTCQVTAMNSVGEGSPSASSIAATPGALTNGTCGATHNLPLSSTPSSQLCTTGNATTVTGVGPWFWGCIGTNGGSNSSCLAPVSPPPLVAPVITAVGAGDSSVVLSFNGAAQDNGAPVLGYLVNCSSVGAGASVTTYGVDTPMGISGLTNGQTYTCTATASNNDGLGIVSAPSAQFVPLSSNMSYISLNTGSLSFGDQNIGTTSAAKTITLTNTGKTTLNISNIQLNIGVFAVTHTCGSSLAAHASCYVYVSFSPVASGGQTGAITFSSTAVNSPLVTVSGNGAANAPSCTLSAMPARIPPGRPTTLTPTCAPAATSYAWTGGTCQGTTASTCTVTPAATTTYGFTGTNSYGSSTASATGTVKAVDLTPILMLLLD